MRAKLYGMAVSHPANAARLMLEHKGIDYDLVDVPPGLQAIRVPLAGFRHATVPALRLGDRKVQGSLAISRALETVRPDPPLFPADPERRRAVEEAEAWGESELQPIPRRLLRWALSSSPGARRAFTKQLGFPAVAAHALIPGAKLYARREEAHSLDRVRADHAAMPGHLDRVDALIADGVLGGELLSAADFQIGTTLRALLSMADYTSLIEGRPAEDLARRVWPDFSAGAPKLIPA